MVNLLVPTAEPMIDLEEKGGSYCVAVTIDSSYSWFNGLCYASSFQNINLYEVIFIL